MFGMGPQEILIILVVALIFIGPKRLPEIARTLGKGFGELKRAMDDIKGQVNIESVMKEPDQEEEPPKKDINTLETFLGGSISPSQVEESKAADGEENQKAPEETET
jgi:Tat protein translocase TatB subunit